MRATSARPRQHAEADAPRMEPENTHRPLVIRPGRHVGWWVKEQGERRPIPAQLVADEGAGGVDRPDVGGRHRAARS